MASSEITLEAVSSVSQIPAEDWDACANPSPDPGSLNGLDTLASSNTAKIGHCAPDFKGTGGRIRFRA